MRVWAGISLLVYSIAAMAWTGPSVTESGTSAQAATPPPIIVIGFVGGFVKHNDAGHVEVQLAAHLHKSYPSGLYVRTFENRHRDRAHQAILRLLDRDHDQRLTPEERKRARIIIYGHSWGGSETITLAKQLEREGIPVLLTIQVDSISKLGEKDDVVPPNVAEAINFYQPNGLFHGRSQIRAANPARTHILGNFRMEYKQRPLTCGSCPWYARFMKTHLEIECDPAVWNRVESLIRSQLVPLDAGFPL